mmetsp:Transcript_24891/g.61139  ORF Transcript_24891/g.61139 Transcript_24891/m.61139 type:complete len:276 (+) Transcript_24891:2715-3542(+)
MRAPTFDELHQFGELLLELSTQRALVSLTLRNARGTARLGTCSYAAGPTHAAATNHTPRLALARAFVVLAGALEEHGHEGLLGGAEHGAQGVVDGVPVLLEEGVHVVLHLAREVRNDEACLGACDTRAALCLALDRAVLEVGIGRRTTRLEMRVTLATVHELAQKVVVRALGEVALVIKQRKHTKLPLEQLHARRVVLKRDRINNNPLLLVLVHHGVQHLVDELLLQGLVGVIDAKLLERVVLEHLKAEDVEDADELALDLATLRIRHLRQQVRR